MLEERKKEHSRVNRGRRGEGCCMCLHTYEVIGERDHARRTYKEHSRVNRGRRGEGYCMCLHTFEACTSQSI